MDTLELPTMQRLRIISFKKSSGRRLRKKWTWFSLPLFAIDADHLRDGVRAGVDVRPEPERRNVEPADGVERLGDLRGGAAELGRDRVLHDDDEVFVGRELRADTAILLERIEGIGVAAVPDLRSDVDRRAAGAMDGLRGLAEANEVLRRELGAREMQVGELGDGVPHLLVDRARDLAALQMGDRDVGVGGRDRGRERLEAVGDRHHHVGPERVEHARQFHDAEAGRLRRGDERLAFDDGIHLGRDRKAVILDRPSRRCRSGRAGRSP